MLPFEKKTILFYHLKFEGIEETMIIEARNKNEALEFVAQEVTNRGIKVNLEDIKLSTPIFGVTTKQEGGVKYIWVGFEYSPSGWMIKDNFAGLKNIDKYL